MKPSDIVESTLKWDKQARLIYEQLPSKIKLAVIKELGRMSRRCREMYQVQGLAAHQHIAVDSCIDMNQDDYYLDINCDYVELSTGVPILFVSALREFLDVSEKQIIIDLTDEIFYRMDVSLQILVAIHEDYIGPIEKCIKHKEGFKLTNEVLNAISEKFDLNRFE